jgi:transposase-like protein
VVCRRSFKALTGTPLARLRLRDKWLPYLRCMIDSTTVRTAAERVAVAKSTSFPWRHRFIAGVGRELRPKLSGVVE